MDFMADVAFPLWTCSADWTVSITSSSWRPCSRMLMGLDIIYRMRSGVVSAASHLGTLNGTFFCVQRIPEGGSAACYCVISLPWICPEMREPIQFQDADPSRVLFPIRKPLSDRYPSLLLQCSCSFCHPVWRLLCLNTIAAIRTRDRTADVSALKRSVPREQGSRIRHSRPEDSAARACRLHTAMSEVVGSERSEGGGLTQLRVVVAVVAQARLHPSLAPRCSSVLDPGQFLLPCMQLSHRTHGGPIRAAASWTDG